MGLFHFGKKKEETEQECACNVTETQKKEESCCCGSKTADAEPENCCCQNEMDSLVSIKVLGSGCKSCHALYENTKEAVKNAGLSVEVEYVTDLEKIMEYGVMCMPGLVVNETVVSAGKVLKPADIEKLLQKSGR
ncbi:MAG: thioredoxin family protein [Lachnospiraceae bacterium]